MISLSAFSSIRSMPLVMIRSCFAVKSSRFTVSSSTSRPSFFTMVANSTMVSSVLLKSTTGLVAASLMSLGILTTSPTEYDTISAPMVPPMTMIAGLNKNRDRILPSSKVNPIKRAPKPTIIPMIVPFPML